MPSIFTALAIYIFEPKQAIKKEATLISSNDLIFFFFSLDIFYYDWFVAA